MPQLLLAHGVRMIDLVAEDQEGDFGEVFHGEEGVELDFGFGETLVIFGVDEEDDAADFGEVVAPETAGWEGLAGGGMDKGRYGEGTLLMAAEVEGCEFDVADGEFFGCWRGQSAGIYGAD